MASIFRSLGRSLAARLPQNDAVPRLQYWLRYRKRRRVCQSEPPEGFSLVLATRNRRQFLSCAVTTVIANTRAPFELILMDNASNDGSAELCRSFEIQHPGIVRHVRLERNVGTNAYALGFLQARYAFLVDMDDDILALSKGWDRATFEAFRAFPRLGFLAMNVVQDRFTDGAKKGRDAYSEVVRSKSILELGPTGGWFAVTTRRIYDEVGGFVFHPYKPFPPEDGKYIRRLSKYGYFAGILKNHYVYHASGAYWNRAYGYETVWDEKYRRDHEERLSVIRDVQVGEVPTAQYAERMVVQSEQQGGCVFRCSGLSQTATADIPG